MADSLEMNPDYYILDRSVLKILTAEDNRKWTIIVGEALFVAVIIVVSFLRLNQSLNGLNIDSSDYLIDFLTTNWWSAISIPAPWSKSLYYIEMLLYLISPFVIKDRVFGKTLSARGIFFGLVILFKTSIPWLMKKASVGANADIFKQLIVFGLHNLNIISTLAAIVILYIMLSYKLVSLLMFRSQKTANNNAIAREAKH